MDKNKALKFLRTPWGMISLVLIVVVLVFAYASKIPGLRWLQMLGARLPGSDASAPPAPAA